MIERIRLDGPAPGSEPPSVAVAFLQKLRSAGPWVLSAIVPDGPITTITARTAAEVDAFVRKHDGRRNLYFSVNPTRRVMNCKAKKSDIASIEYLFGDLDPFDDETPTQAKSRYLDKLDGTEQRPTACVDSGNGLQTLWKLDQAIALEPGATGTIADIENRTKALMLRLGTKTGTQNIDRILRLPGTTNLPSDKKRKAGRVKCETELLWFNGATHPLAAFPPEHCGNSRKKPSGDSQTAPDDGEEDELARTIRDGGADRHGKSRSEALWWCICEMLRGGYAAKAIVAVLLDKQNGISEHIYDQPGTDPAACAARQIAHAKKKIGFATDDKNVPYRSRENINVAMLKLGVGVRYDRFADQIMIAGLDGFGPTLNDPALIRLWFTVERRFRLKPSKETMFDVVGDTARLNGFNPVRDYLDSLVWDRKKRIDTWLTNYAQARDNDYTRAVGALMLTAAVRRVRHPGCKFDEMLLLENAEQGDNKSSALRILATRDEWFTDQLPLNLDGREVIELLRGKWIIEAAELGGMRRGEIEHVKAMLSRQYDRGRLVWDRMTSDVPRQSVIVGTTNDELPFKDTTGNRRFWPVACKEFDLDGLKADRDQLWAEAAAREATGASIRLPRELWPMAAREQAKRLTEDPYLPALQHEIGEMEGKISSKSLWEILGMRIGQTHQDQARRVSNAMVRLGWRRANSAQTIKIDGKDVSGWVKGPKPWREIATFRDVDGKIRVDQEQ